MLRDLLAITGIGGSYIVCGTDYGNHVVWLAMVTKAEHILVIEPDPERMRLVKAAVAHNCPSRNIDFLPEVGDELPGRAGTLRVIMVNRSGSIAKYVGALKSTIQAERPIVTLVTLTANDMTEATSSLDTMSYGRHPGTYWGPERTYMHIPI
jgi:hypothetical protein